MEPLGPLGGPGEPPVELVQKFFLDGLFCILKLKVGHICIITINNYQISLSFLNAYNLYLYIRIAPDIQPDIRPFFYPVSDRIPGFLCRISGRSIDEIVDVVSNVNYIVLT